MIDQLLDLYGEEEHEGNGVVVRYFSKWSIRRMERDFGRRAAGRLSDWFDVYKVMTLDGLIITTGHRTRRIHRK